jgi:hypothetical protein
MNILSFNAVELYLAHRQVYFRREILNSDFKSIADGNWVHNIGDIQVRRLDERRIVMELEINGQITTITQYCGDLAFFAWVKTQFVPVSELICTYYDL